MRIVSQDGKIDVPYDHFSLSMGSGKYKDAEVAYIYCQNSLSPIGTKLAEYSAEAKAVKAMEMLREKYLENSKMYTGSAWTCEIVSLAKVFQFPQDNEIEV